MPLSKRHKKLLMQLQHRQGRKKLDYFICEGSRCSEEAISHAADQIELVIYSSDLNEKTVDILNEITLQGGPEFKYIVEHLFLIL